MTRKDYGLIADIIASLMPVGDNSSAHAQWLATAGEFESRLRSANPRFNSIKFFRACRGE